MSSIENNRAAWLVGTGKPLEIGPGPDQTNPQGADVIIQVKALAINPADWKVQGTDFLGLKYPAVLGADVAGFVVKVGPDATRFQVGDRIMANTIALIKNSDRAARLGGFQEYVTADERLAAPLPDSMSFEQATVMPLGITTSVCGLQDALGLQAPTITDGNGNAAANKGKAVLIWGGSTAVGLVAVQLASAAGYAVLTTASPRNRELVQSLGDRVVVFDHADLAAAASQILAYLLREEEEEENKLVFSGAFDCWAEAATLKACADVAAAFGGEGGGGTVASTLPGDSGRADVRVVPVWAGDALTKPGHAGPSVWQNYIGAALGRGLLQPLPRALVVGKGLETIQQAMETQRQGVSASKVVVSL